MRREVRQADESRCSRIPFDDPVAGRDYPAAQYSNFEPYFEPYSLITS